MGFRFIHVGLTVADIAASAAFYAQLGFTPAVPQPVDANGQWIKTMTGFPDAELKIAWQELGGVTLELLQYVAPEGGKKTPLLTKDAGSAHIAIGVEDIHEQYARLAAAGVRFRSEPIVVTDGIRRGNQAVYATDPDGNTVELFEPAQRPRTA